MIIQWLRRYRQLFRHSARRKVSKTTFGRRPEPLEERVLLSAVQFDARIVFAPTSVESDGEVDVLPDSLPFVTEWDSFLVEVWVSTPGGTDLSITSASFDLNYDTSFFTATSIEHGAGFDLSETGTIDDASGVVNNLGAATLSIANGDTQFALLARVQFESMLEDGVSINLSDRTIGPFDSGVSVSNTLATLSDSSNADTLTGIPPAMEVFANPTDFDDDGVISFGDVIVFAEAFGSSISTVPAGDAAQTWNSDLDKDGSVTFGDVTFLAANFGTARNSLSPVRLPATFQQTWRPADLTADLFNDTGVAGTTDSDGVTTDERVAGLATINASTAGVLRFSGILDSTDVTDFVDFVPQLQNGQFTLDPDALLILNSGAAVAGGAHTLRLRVEDSLGNLSPIVEVPFELVRFLLEGDSFVSETTQRVDLTTPVAGTRTIDIDLDLSFDESDDGPVLEDVFNIYLVDVGDPSNTLLDEGTNGTPLFTQAGDQIDLVNGLVSFDGSTVSIDVTGITGVTEGDLLFQLINSDDDVTTRVNSVTVTNTVDADAASGPEFDRDRQTIAPGGSLDLGSFTTSTIVEVLVSGVRLDSGTGQYVADVRVRNTGADLGRELAVVIPNLPGGVSVTNASGTDGSGNAYLNMTPAIRGGGLHSGAVSDPVQITFSNVGLVRFAIEPTVLVGAPNQAPVLDAIPTLSVMPGDQLRVPLTATDADGDELRFMVIPNGDLPALTLEADNSLTISPLPGDVGSYTFDVEVTDGTLTDSQTVTLDVLADTITTTRVSGVVVTTGSTPVEGIEVELSGVTAMTDASGVFQIELPAVAGLVARGARTSVRLVLNVNGGGGFGSDAALLAAALRRDMIANVNNVLPEPLHLTPLDSGGFVAIAPGQNQSLTTTLPGGETAELTVIADSVTDSLGQPFSGMLTVAHVPVDLAPAALPLVIQPDVVVTVQSDQPGQTISFDIPAPIDLPNLVNLDPGTLTELRALNPDSGTFEVVGTGRVSTDGSMIETTSGGLPSTGPAFFAPVAATTSTQAVSSLLNQVLGCRECEETVVVHQDEFTTSTVSLHSGNVEVAIDLPGVNTNLNPLGPLSFVFDQARATGQQLIHWQMDNVSSATADVIAVRVTLTNGDTSFVVPGSNAGAALGLPAGMHFFAVPAGTTGSVTGAIPAGLSSLLTGLYTVEVQQAALKIDASGGGMIASGEFASVTHDRIVINGSDNPFGFGVGIAGIKQVVIGNGGALVIDGDGSELSFTVGSIVGEFIAPPGSQDIFVQNPDATFTLTDRNQTVHSFGTDGLMTEITDRNGNQAVINRIGNDIVSIIGPEGTTSFSTDGDEVTVRDVAGRETKLTISGLGDLTQLVLPDSSILEFEYSDHELTSLLTPDGTAQFLTINDSLVEVVVEGSILRIRAAQLRNLDSGDTLDINDPPPATPLPEDTDSVTAQTVDANGSVTVTQLDGRGQRLGSSDASGTLRQAVRDANADIAQMIDGNGNRTVLLRDDRGNIIQTIDEASAQQPVNGSISRAGERVVYTFEVTEPLGLFTFDALEGGSNVAWSLRSTLSDSRIVDNRLFSQSDGASVSGEDAVLRLPQGTYELEIHAPEDNSDMAADTTGPFSFVLRDLQNSFPLASDETRTGDLASNQSPIYRIEGIADSRLVVDIDYSEFNSATVLLVNPAGVVVSRQALNAGRVVFDLPTDGTHYVVVDGNGSESTTEFSLTPYLAAPIILSLLPNTPTTATLDTPADQIVYTIDLTERALLRFDPFDAVPFLVTLDGDFGTLFTGRADTGTFNTIVATPGSYTLTIEVAEGFGGELGFTLINYAPTSISPNNVLINLPVLPASSSSREFIEGKAGDVYNINVVNRTPFAPTGMRLSLIDLHDGSTVQESLLPNGLASVTLPHDGQFAIEVDGAVTSTGSDFITLEPEFLGNSGFSLDGTPILLDTTVSGSVTAGSDENFTWTQSAPGLVYIDNLLSSSAILTLTGDTTGEVITDRSLSFSEEDIAVQFLPAGVFQLGLKSLGGTQNFEFQILPLDSTVTDITAQLGTPQQIVLDPGNSTPVLRFDAIEGQVLYFESLGFNGSFFTGWRLVDSFANELFNTNTLSTSTSFSDAADIRIPATGTYYLLIEGELTDQAAPVFDFQITEQVVDSQPIDITDPLLITVNIASPGSSFERTFTVPEPMDLSIDIQDSIIGGRISLSTPLMTVLDNVSTDQFVSLPPGDYTLRINALNDATGEINARVQDLADAPAFISGMPVTGTLLSNERGLFRFNVTKDDRYVVDQDSGNSSSLQQTLFDQGFNPLNTRPASLDLPRTSSLSTYPDERALTADLTGEILITIDNNSSSSETFTTTLHTLDQSIGSVTLGSSLSGAIDHAGEIDQVFIDAPSETWIYLDSVTNNSDLLISVENGSRERFISRINATDTAQPLLHLPPGTATFSVFGVDIDDTGSYVVNISDPFNGTAVTPGTPFSSSFASTQTWFVNFDASAGDEFMLDAVALSGSFLQYRVWDPDGNQLVQQSFSSEFSDVAFLSVPTDGTYALGFEGFVNSASGNTDFTFNVVPLGNTPVTPPAPSTGIELGQLVSSDISVSGEQDIYSVVIDEPKQLYLDLRTSNSQLRYTIDGPQGTVINNQAFTTTDNRIDETLAFLPSGEYRITISGSGAATGAYEFRLFDLVDAATAITPGNIVTSQLNPASESEAFAFNGLAGQRLFFDTNVNSTLTGQWRLLDPSGTPQFNDRLRDDQDITLESDGVYILIVEGFNTLTTPLDYSFSVNIANPPAQSLSVPTSLGRQNEYDPIFNVPTRLIDELGRQTINEIDGNGNITKTTRVVGSVGGSDDVVTEFTYTSQGLLDERTDPLGRITDFDYDAAGRVTQIIRAKGTPQQTIESFEYDSAGNLTAIVDPNLNRTDFEYDALGRVTLLRDALGNESEFVYDSAGNLISFNDALDRVSTFTYDSLRQLTSATDPLGAVRRLVYDRNGNVLQDIDELLRVTTSTYDTRNRLTAISDPAGATTRFSYDHNDNLVAVTDPQGNISRSEYDAVNRLTATVDPLQNRTTFGYDLVGNLVTVLNADGATTTFRYDELDRLFGTFDALNNFTTNVFDAAGNLTSTIDPRGNSTMFAYDALDRIVRVADAQNEQTNFQYDANGNVTQSTDALNRPTNFQYDARNRQTRVTDADSNVTDFTYDAVGNLTEIAAPIGRTTTFGYDGRDRLTGITDALNNTATTTYDAAGQVSSITDRLGRTSRFEYDAVGRTVLTIDPLGNQTATAYDPNGNVASITDARGNTTEFTYDARDLNTLITDALDGESAITYDAVGRAVSLTDPLDRTSQFDYDLLGRLTSSIDPLGNTFQSVYDSAGNVILTTDALGNSTNFEYDNLNRQVTTFDALGNPIRTEYDAFSNVIRVVDPLMRETTFVYDDLNRLAGTADELAHGTTFTYDALSNLTRQTDELGNETDFTYDVLGRRTAVIDANDDQTSFTYDDEGNVLTLTDASNNTTSYVYDALDRILSATNESGNARTFRYDAVGNLNSRTDRNGRVVNFTHDELNRLTFERWIGTAGQQVVNAVATTYDAASQITGISDGFSSYGYTHDAAGRLVTSNNQNTPGVPQVLLTYTYDGNSNRLTVQDTIDGEVSGLETFAYDALNRVTQLTQSAADPAASVAEKRVDYTYDAASQLTTIERYSDLDGMLSVVQTAYAYDGAGRLTDLDHTNSTGNVATYDYTYDDINRITRINSTDGESIFTYDPTGQLTGSTFSFLPVETFTYDATGNRTNTGHTTGDDNRLLSDGVHTYEYDGEGNRTSRTETATDELTAYTWDHRNRLTSVVVTDSGGTVLSTADYTYDALDRRITKTVDTDGAGPDVSDTEVFVHDGNEIALVFDGDGNQTERYLHGPGIDQVLAWEDPTGTVTWTLPDHQSTVRDVTDSNGNVTNHIVYNAFGVIMSQSDPTNASRFTYTGREFDSETGLFYYRNRYYDASAGRFIGEDPIGFAAGDVNLSRYVGNDPGGRIDPFGLQDNFEDADTTETRVFIAILRGLDLFGVSSANRRERGEPLPEVARESPAPEAPGTEASEPETFDTVLRFIDDGFLATESAFGSEESGNVRRALLLEKQRREESQREDECPEEQLDVGTTRQSSGPLLFRILNGIRDRIREQTQTPVISEADQQRAALQLVAVLVARAAVTNVVAAITGVAIGSPPGLRTIPGFEDRDIALSFVAGERPRRTIRDAIRDADRQSVVALARLTEQLAAEQERIERNRAFAEQRILRQFTPDLFPDFFLFEDPDLDFATAVTVPRDRPFGFFTTNLTIEQLERSLRRTNELIDPFFLNAPRTGEGGSVIDGFELDLVFS